MRDFLVENKIDTKMVGAEQSPQAEAERKVA